MKCTDCGYENIDSVERCTQCGAALKKGDYVASVEAGLKRLEEEKLAFMTGCGIASKYSTDDIARYSAMAPLDEQVIDSLVDVVDETAELKSIAAMSDEESKKHVIPNTGTAMWNPANELPSMTNGGAATSFEKPSADKVSAQTCMGVGRNMSESECIVADVVDSVLGDIDDAQKSLDSIQEIKLDDAEIESVDCESVQDLDLNAIENGSIQEISLSDADIQEVSLSEVEAQEVSDDMLEGAAEHASGTHLETADIQEVSVDDADVQDLGMDDDEIQEVEVSDADDAEIQDVSADDVELIGVKGQDTNATVAAAFADNDALRAKCAMAADTVYDEVQNIDDFLQPITNTQYSALEPEDASKLAKSAYASLSLENVEADETPSDEAQSDADVAELPEKADVSDEPAKPNAAVLRHDFCAAERVKIPEDASALEKLKAQGLFETGHVHAEVSKNIDELILDEYLPRATFETWHGQSIEDIYAADHPEEKQKKAENWLSDDGLRAYSNIQAESLLDELIREGKENAQKLDEDPDESTMEKTSDEVRKMVESLELDAIKAENSEANAQNDSFENGATVDSAVLDPILFMPEGNSGLEETLILTDEEDDSEITSALPDDMSTDEGETRLMSERPSADALKAAMEKELRLLAAKNGNSEKTMAVSEEQMLNYDNAEEDEDDAPGDHTVVSEVDYQSIVGAVNAVAPGNERLAEIAGQIAPKKTSESVCVAMAHISKEIACPYDADDEKRKDKKMLNSLEDDGLDKEDPEFASKKPKIVNPKKQHRLKLASCDSLQGYQEDTLGSMPKAAPRKSLADCDPVQSVDLSKAVKPSSGKKAFSNIMWGLLLIVVVTGIVYLLYLMGVLASLDPSLAPKKEIASPHIVSAPSYVESPLAVKNAIEEASAIIGKAGNYEAYMLDELKTQIGAIELNDPEADKKMRELNELGHEMYPQEMSFTTEIINAMINSEHFEEARSFIAALSEEQRATEDMRDLWWQTFSLDTHFNPGIQTIQADDFESMGPLGGGSTVTFKFMKDGKEVAAFKPLQINKQSNYRAEIAAWRLCELISCDFDIPYNKEIRVETNTFNTLYARSKSSKAAAYRAKFSELTWTKDSVDGKTYLYGTYKDWVPDFTRFPIELTSVWKSWLTAEKPKTDWEDLSKALAPYNKNANTQKLYAELMNQAKKLTTEGLAAQISEVLVFDYLLGNWDRFSGVPEWWGVNCQFKDGAIISIDNGAGFQRGTNDKVIERYMMVERFSRHFVEKLRMLEKENTCNMLFPNPSNQDTASCDQFWKQRDAFLKRVDTLVERYGEQNVLSFP